MAKFRKDDLKSIVKELVKESLLEILAEEFIEEATFRAVESASSQIVGTVTGQINKQLKPIIEGLQNSSISRSSYSSLPPSRKDDDYIENLEEDYESVSVEESFGISDLLGDPDSVNHLISNVRNQMRQERGDNNQDAREKGDKEEEDDFSVSKSLGFDLDNLDLKGPSPTSKIESYDFQNLIKSSSSTLREQTSAAKSSIGPEMFNIYNENNTVPHIENNSDPLFFKKIVDKVNQKKSVSSPILGAQAAAAQKAFAQAQMTKIADSDLDRPAHEVIKHSR